MNGLTPELKRTLADATRLTANATPLCIAPERLRDLPSPAFVVDGALIERNLKVLDAVQHVAECSIVLALKAFAMPAAAPLVMRYLAGTTASGLHEAQLAREVFGAGSVEPKAVHTYGPAYADDEIEAIVAWSDHLSFNSPGQWRRFQAAVARAERPPVCGLRVNPEHSEVDVALYDPCAPCSRLGTTAAQLVDENLDTLFGPGRMTGLHVHTLCECGAEALGRTMAAMAAKFGHLYERVSWLNLGGGHHITRPGYDLDLLVQLIRDHRAATGHAVILEPGEAVALNAGVLLATVLDVVHNTMPIAVLDVSATAHMPDVLEMPYRPEVALLPADAAASDVEVRDVSEVVEVAGEPGAKRCTIRLTGPTCLAGDVIGDFSFDRALMPGDRLIFGDMAHYSMVKTTTFNGVRLPSMIWLDPDPLKPPVVTRPGYLDYRNRLG